jgi:hypothetical protein
MKKIAVIVLLFLFFKTNAQILTGFSARYNNDFVDWEIYTDKDSEKGNLTMTWQQPDDWTQWSYRIGEQTGTIKTKWGKDLSQWEVRGENKVITIQPYWQGDPNNWRITDNDFSLELQTKWRGRVNEWYINDSKRGQMNIFSEYQNDPRDWIIEDELEEVVSFPMKMAIIYIVIFNSVPR